MKTKRLRPLISYCLQDIKDIIKDSNKATGVAKQVMLHLINKSKGMTHPVKIISPKDNTLGEKISLGSHHMCSWAVSHPLRLNSLMLGL